MQYLALKTNLLYDATTTPNLGLEVSMGKHFTLDVSGNYNPRNFLYGYQLYLSTRWNLEFTTGLLLFAFMLKAQDRQPKNYTGSVYVKQNLVEVRNDSVFLDMDITLEGVDLYSKNSLILTPVLFAGKDSLALPYIRINGKHKDRMYKRAVTLSKRKKEDRSAYVVLRQDPRGKQMISYRNTLLF